VESVACGGGGKAEDFGATRADLPSSFKWGEEKGGCREFNSEARRGEGRRGVLSEGAILGVPVSVDSLSRQPIWDHGKMEEAERPMHEKPEKRQGNE
jgi:hypothetical protein